ncbi:radical SAM protein [Candidatus Bathyarchaeota archaeon]|nr:radical SAM protein [Candidatus Bathyarchaeota archaeon]
MTFSPYKALSLFERSTIPNRPYHVQWFLTQKCNYRCRGCNVWRNKQNVKELSVEEVKEGLDVLRKLGTIEIVFSGGNPLLRDDIDEIIEYSSKYFITTVYDNGSMALKKIDALRKADFVAISLDSLDEEKNDYLRGVKGAWKKSMEAIMKLHENGIRVGVAATISQFNINEIIDLTKYFTSFGIPVWYSLYQYDPSGSQLFKIGNKVDEFEIKDKQQLVKLFDELIALKRKRKGIFITERTLKTLKHLFLYGERLWKCQALQSFFMINPQGKVAGCHLLEPVASIFELPKLWNSERFKKFREKYEKCTKCAYLCYIFYSLYSDVRSNMELIFTQQKDIKLLIDNFLNARKNMCQKSLLKG